MKKIMFCGRLFVGTEETARQDQALVIENGRITHVLPRAAMPAPAPGDTVIDHSSRFVMPGLSDLHTHLSYGNARSEEEVDLYPCVEYRAIRALAGAQRMLAAGYTALLDPASSGLVGTALRDALYVRMFPGPRVTAAGPAITSRQGLYDYYPSWIGCPPCSTGRLVRSLPEAIEAIREQTKNTVDIIKLAMDGIQGGNSGGLYAAFTQEETTAMVREAHRLGRKVAVHVRGAEGALYAARAGVDILYHASRISEEGIRAAVGEGCAICPSLMLLVNNIEYAQPDDPSYDWWPNIQRRELADASVSLRGAYEAGIPFLSGSETGFAVTPYGEFCARELSVMMRYLDIGASEVLQMATHRNRSMLRGGREYDGLAAGKRADFLVFDGNPLDDITQLEERARFLEIWMDGQKIVLPEMPAEIPRHPSESSQGMWNRVYTRAAILQRKAEDTALPPGTLVQHLPEEFV
nr:amidohydrolase family protein [uncultured Lichenicoccus sp.]